MIKNTLSNLPIYTMSLYKMPTGLKLRLEKSLLGKWNWRLATEDNPPWKKLIKLKYGLEVGEWFSKEPKGSFRVGLWKDIRKEGQQMKQDCKLVLGNGVK